MKWLRRILLIALVPLLRVVGGMTRKRSTLGFSAYDHIVHHVHPGDVILTTKRRSLTAWLIPGEWSHAALVVDGGEVIHAVYPKVTRAPIMELVLASSSVAVLRPRFAPKPLYASDAKAVQYAEQQVGLPYDLKFDHDVASFYCSELVWRAWQHAVPTWHFTARERLGVPTVTPSDLYDARSSFDVVTTRTIKEKPHGN